MENHTDHKTLRHEIQRLYLEHRAWLSEEGLSEAERMERYEELRMQALLNVAEARNNEEEK